jgi:signal transduction histidine kinase
MTQTARRVSEERLDERIDLRGPRDELHELAQTLDAMLDRLEAGVDAQRRFVANASHELRSPLTVIRTEAEVVLGDPDAGAEELRSMGEVVLEATGRTESLLEGLLLLARAQRSLRRSDAVDLGALVRRVAESERPRAEEQRLALRLDLEPATVRGDAQLLERLVANLVDNAVRYGEPGRPLEIEVRAGDTARLRVANGGPRLPEDALERLAEPFERLERTADGRGSGLGLSIVRSVAEAHGGTLALKARPAGGLEARVEVPLAGDLHRADRDGAAARVLIRT